MTDTMSAKARSAVMTAIKSRGNRSTELVMASLLRRSRIRGWRRHRRLLASPDFVPTGTGLLLG
jgi:G:T-mismatch repair DNA endonuclease (very short patch repair protein)